MTENALDRNSSGGDAIAAYYRALAHQCYHNDTATSIATGYCLIVASIFVGALYVFVPSRVRRLNRDDPEQIKWRAMVSFLVCINIVGTYPYIFCNLQADSNTSLSSSPFSVLQRIGWIIPPFNILVGVLLHTAILYCGPIVSLFLRVYIMLKLHQQQQEHGRSRNGDNGINQNMGAIKSALRYLQAFYEYTVEPKIFGLLQSRNESERWQIIRNLIVAPLVEEIIFRGCFVSVLLSSSNMKPLTITFLSPLFFGLAHCHHAVLKVQSGEKPLNVFIVTLIQFTYTSLFGSYTAHAFLRSGSILAIFLSHSFCNGMGLPSIHFLRPGSFLYPYRFILILAHIIGIIGFTWAFASSWFLPLPGVLL